MGGCASAPKNLKDDSGSAPVPEPSKEETVETNETVKVELEAVEKVEQEAIEKVVEENIEKNDEDKKSLGSLLNENEVKEEPTKESKAEEVPSEKKQEQ